MHKFHWDFNIQTDHLISAKGSDQLIVNKERKIGIGGIGNKRMSEDYPNNSIGEIGQNTEKSLGDLRELAVT